ncbi:XP_036364214.1uncharacterized protein LOC118765797 [Octopus vulgaris]|uniref:XP_036364214.1uncharacterized protein LOC118765797 n=1 Tax=Octopus vulgaris TaxID=6645 RepID=A0AA36BDS9_OCTVU|nr:XP_036364214.1uncharacterized protein LOC118765797 [Octopus vulgaris]
MVINGNPKKLIPVFGVAKISHLLDPKRPVANQQNQGSRSTIVMVRHYKRKSERATLPQDVIQQAIQQVRARIISLREASRTFGIPLKSLSRYCTKADEANNNDHSLSGYKKPRQVLADEFENQLEAYVLAAAEITMGLLQRMCGNWLLRWQRQMDVISLQPGMRQKWQVKTGSLDIFNDTRIYA